MRFYFYGRDGQEIDGHPLQGAAISGSGAYVQHPVGLSNGWPCKKEAFTKGDKRVTIEDFPGHTAVQVKCWATGGSRWFWLV